MSGPEVVAIVFGLLLGYWIISSLGGGKKDHQTPTRQDSSELPPLAPLVRQLHWTETLGVSEHASAEEVKAAYRSRIQQYHPDKVASLGEELKVLANEKSREIKAAYEKALSAIGDRT